MAPVDRAETRHLCDSFLIRGPSRVQPRFRERVSPIWMFDVQERCPTCGVSRANAMDAPYNGRAKVPQPDVELRALCPACTTVPRARADQGVSLFALAADRVPLPPSADLFRLWRSGDRALRIVGGRMDDARAARALSSVWNVGSRFRAGFGSAARALVPSLALRTLARNQRRALTHHGSSCMSACSRLPASLRP